jgi:hypothetical protein
MSFDLLARRGLRHHARYLVLRRQLATPTLRTGRPDRTGTPGVNYKNPVLRRDDKSYTVLQIFSIGKTV